MTENMTFINQLSARKQWQAFASLLSDLASEGKEVSDADILRAFMNYKDSLRTSADVAADALISGMASICAYRPLLLSQLINDALEPMLMCGVENTEEVHEWVFRFMENDNPIMGAVDAKAVIWLREVFLHSDELINASIMCFMDEA